MTRSRPLQVHGNAETEAAPLTGQPHVRFSSVSKSFDGVHEVVKSLDLDVVRGEFLTLLGPSGSGKTTCLMMLAGFESPSSGEITIADRVVTHVPAHKRGIGMVFQDYALFPHMDVFANIAYPLKVRGYSGREISKLVNDALAMVKLDGFAKRVPASLSGGQRQRVALARAIVFEPEVILMDEPLGALDRQLREHMQFEIKALHDRLGVTVIYVTHDQQEALTMSSRVAIFNDGRIQQIGLPSEVYEKSANSFVAQFVGENNVIPGVVESLSEARCAVRLADGKTIVATPVAVSAAGDETSVSIRPERILVGDAAVGCENLFRATLREIIYVGDHLRLLVDLFLPGGLVIKVPVASVQGVGDPGGEITVGWAAEHCRALNPVS